MTRALCVAALLSAFVIGAAAQSNTTGQGIITVQNGIFVDAGCREYQFAGGNV